MLKTVSDEKASESIINHAFSDSLLGPCEYDAELDKTIRQFYPNALSWSISRDIRFHMKHGYCFIASVWLEGESVARSLWLKCFYSKKKGFYFVDALPKIRVATKETTKNWYEVNERIIQELNDKALENNETSFLLPLKYIQGTPKNIIEECLTQNAFGPIFIDEGVVCTARKIIEL